MHITQSNVRPLIVSLSTYMQDMRSGRNNMFWSCRHCKQLYFLWWIYYYLPQFNINGRRGLLCPIALKIFSTPLRFNNIKSLRHIMWRRVRVAFGALLHSWCPNIYTNDDRGTILTEKKWKWVSVWQTAMPWLNILNGKLVFGT